ncbi:MAG: hypothetical protein CMI21_09960 [Opitutae bacterium]|nr:hypothetical protein [Opitutae bacterium]
MVRILATADWQMGMRGNLSRRGREHLAKARVAAIERIIEVAEKEEVDVILAAGDLFEFPHVSDDVSNSVASALQKTKIEIHAIPGNRDLYGPGTVWKTPQIQNIKLFNPHFVEEGGDRVTKTEIKDNVFLHSIPVTNKYDTNRQDEYLEDVSDGTHIVMAHAHDLSHVDYFKDEHESDCKLPIKSEKVIKKGYSLIVLGHWHSWLEVGGSNRVVYPGTHEQTKFGDRDAGWVAIIEVPEDGGEPEVRRERVGATKWATEEFDCTGKSLPEDLVEFVQGQKDAGVDYLRLVLTGEVGVDEMAEAIPNSKSGFIPMFEHFEMDLANLATTIDVDAMMSNVDLPMGLREIQAQIISEIESSKGDEWATSELMEELGALYSACRDAGIV